MLSLGLEWQMCLVKRLLLGFSYPAHTIRKMQTALPAAGTLSVRRGRGHVGQQHMMRMQAMMQQYYRLFMLLASVMFLPYLRG